MHRSTQRGFTLIELVVVIVILGILAAFAVPRFMGLENKARIAAVQAVGGSLESAATMAHGVWEASGDPATLTISGVNNNNPITMTNGYPATANIVSLLQDTAGFTVQAGGGGEQFFPNGAVTTGTCYVKYTPAANANTPYTVTYAGLAATATQAQIQTALKNAC